MWTEGEASLAQPGTDTGLSSGLMISPLLSSALVEFCYVFMYKMDSKIFLLIVYLLRSFTSSLF